MRTILLTVFILVFGISAIGYANDNELDQRIDSLIKILVDVKGQERKDAFIELKEIGEPVLPEALKLYRDESKTGMVKGYALALIASIGTDEVVPYLEEATSDEHMSLRWSAIRYLGEIGTEQAVAVLISIYKNPSNMNTIEQYYAAEALKKVRNREAIPLLIEAMNDEDMMVDETGIEHSISRIAIKALGNIGDPSVIIYFENKLESDPMSGPSVVSALGEISGEESKVLLKKIVNDKKMLPRAKEEAKKALEKLDSPESVFVPSIQ